MLVGQQFGPFTIDKELGSGAMGTVYLGRYSKTGQVMAIKVMAPSIGSTNAAAADRFEREIAILKQLNHPNIVRFYGAGKQQKSRYFAMEVIKGESLDKVMSRRGRMTWEEVVTLGRQLCSALQHAHEKGIIHRDLKPSNIMVLSDGTLKLTDFGIAKAADLEALTQTNCTVGTASYMSPEQCKGQSDLTHKSDLYSLGILFYELLVGKKPFKADNAMDMFMLHVNGTFERPSRMILDLPVWLDTLVCQLLEKEPDKRPLDAHMVANTLGSIQEKVQAQQSAGVEAVRRRLIDRMAGQKRPDEEDKEAARVLMTGRGRRRKQKKKQFYEKVWFQAVGLVLALGFVATLLYLVFKPPSPDKLYQQAKTLWDAGKTEEAYDGPIHQYLEVRGYDKIPGPQTEQIHAWANSVDVKRCEEKLRKKRKRERKNQPYAPQEGTGEETPFAAAVAEDNGKLNDARELWQKASQEKIPQRWRLVAQNHLRMLDAIVNQDTVFEKYHEAMGKSGVEPELEAVPKQGFLAWRAERFKDRRRARTLYKNLKEDTDEKAAADPQVYPWYLFAAGKERQLADGLIDDPQNEEYRKKHIGKQLEIAKDRKRNSKVADAMRICLDILALYGDDKNEELAEPVKEARQLRDAIDAGFGRKREEKK